MNKKPFTNGRITHYSLHSMNIVLRGCRGPDVQRVPLGCAVHVIIVLQNRYVCRARRVPTRFYFIFIFLATNFLCLVRVRA